MGTHTFEDGYSFRALWTRDKVPAYISWEHWEQNQRKLRENSTKFGFGVSRGSTLLAGRVVCGKCGARMSVHYRDGIPSFDCTKASMQFGEPVCQTFNGRWLEPLVAELVLKAMEPTAVEMSLIAAEDIEQDRARLEKLHQQTVERAKYQADLARRRYEEVDPSNRLVAAELEKRWEEALISQRKREEELNRFVHERPSKLTPQQRETIKDLSNNFRELWNNDATSAKDRQDLVRILFDQIVVQVIAQSECLAVTVHWSGGYISQHETRRTVMRFDDLKNGAELLSRATELYNSGCPRAEMIRQLNAEGYRSARQDQFTDTSINALFLVLRRKGMIGSKPNSIGPWWRSRALSRKLGIKPPTLTGWRHRGWVQTKQVGSRWIFWADADDLPRLQQLASFPAGVEKPDDLTHPKSKMPEFSVNA